MIHPSQNLFSFALTFPRCVLFSELHTHCRYCIIPFSVYQSEFALSRNILGLYQLVLSEEMISKIGEHLTMLADFGGE